MAGARVPMRGLSPVARRALRRDLVRAFLAAFGMRRRPSPRRLV